MFGPHYLMREPPPKPERSSLCGQHPGRSGGAASPAPTPSARCWPVAPEPLTSPVRGLGPSPGPWWQLPVARAACLALRVEAELCGLFLQGAEGQKPGFGYGGRASDYKSAHKGFKGVDAQGTLSRIFKLVRYPLLSSTERGLKGPRLPN